MTPKEKNVYALNEKTIFATKQNGILKGNQRLGSLHMTDKT
jgi:hypothetical protein